MTRESLRRGSLIVNVMVALAMAGVCAGASWGATAPGASASVVLQPGGASWDGGRAEVIVRVNPGAFERLARDVSRLGGRVERKLAIINGFSATVPVSAVARLRGLPGVLSVSSNRRLEPMASGSGYSAVGDMNSMYNITVMSGAQKYWQSGFTGKGVDIALIDSGVVPVDGLTASGKVVNGPDLSFESQAPNLQYLDSYGHGTHMAGIMAGKSTRASAKYVNETRYFLGMAPDARVISIKVADSNGATDVSQVIAAIDWVVQHRNDPGFNIRVINLSYGTDAVQDYRVDPLAFAAEQAVKAGILVVAAAGNDGYSTQGAMTNPAYDPHVLAVGASDPKGTSSLSDDSVPDYSSSGDSGNGTNSRDPDLVAPGKSVVSLRAPGSWIDQEYGSSAGVTAELMKGSGTSQAAAVVSGAAALVIQQRPSITPAQLKALLMRNTTLLSGEKTSEQGQGELDLKKVFSVATPAVTSTAAFSTGLGTLEGSRGTNHLVKDGVTLAGEQDIHGKPFDSAAMALLEANGSSWSGGTWNGSSWSGSSWSGSSWSGSSWSGSSWSGSSWSGSSWSGSSWSSRIWNGSSWSGSSWSGSSWSGSSWSGCNWTGAGWK